jgi:hypothetical protein
MFCNLTQRIVAWPGQQTTNEKEEAHASQIENRDALVVERKEPGLQTMFGV